MSIKLSEKSINFDYETYSIANDVYKHLFHHSFNFKILFMFDFLTYIITMFVFSFIKKLILTQCVRKTVHQFGFLQMSIFSPCWTTNLHLQNSQHGT